MIELLLGIPEKLVLVSPYKSVFNQHLSVDVYALKNKRKRSYAIFGLLTYPYSSVIIKQVPTQSLTNTCKG